MRIYNSCFILLLCHLLFTGCEKDPTCWDRVSASGVHETVLASDAANPVVIELDRLGGSVTPAVLSIKQGGETFRCDVTSQVEATFGKLRSLSSSSGEQSSQEPLIDLGQAYAGASIAIACQNHDGVYLTRHIEGDDGVIAAAEAVNDILIECGLEPTFHRYVLSIVDRTRAREERESQ